MSGWSGCGNLQPVTAAVVEVTLAEEHVVQGRLEHTKLIITLNGSAETSETDEGKKQCDLCQTRPY